METVNIRWAKISRGSRRVSLKFYEMICDQIWSAGRVSDDIQVERMVKAIDEYISEGIVRINISKTETVVLRVLESLIDKAVGRSLRARLAAMRRREAKEAAKEQIAEDAEGQEADERQADEAEGQAAPVPAEETNECASMKSRDELRRERQIQRREAAAARRLEKHRKRLARRHATAPGLT